MYDYVENVCWIVVYLIILVGVHYQFKFCIPVGLWVIKILEAFWILVVIRLYIKYRIYNQTFDFMSFYNDAFYMANTTYHMYKDKFEL